MNKIVLKNINVVDVVNDTVLAGQDVLIEDGVFKKIAVGIEDTDAQVLDKTGNYLVPGVIDMHVHISWDGRHPAPMDLDDAEGILQAYVRAMNHAKISLKKGVTTVREVASANDLAIDLAYTIDKGYAVGCRVVPCGAAIQGTYGHVPLVGTIADTDDEIIKAIRYKKNLMTHKGVTCQWIKIMATGGAAGIEDVGPSMYSLEQLKMIVSECHRLHMKVAAHALSREGIINCIEAGIDTIEHGADIPEEYLYKMKEKGLTLVPTLSVYKMLAASSGQIPEVTVAKAKRVVDQQKKTFADALRIGVNIAMGTDAGSPNFGPHPNAFEELLVMQEYGMDAKAVMKSATITAADVLGLGNEIGSIEVGKKADCIIANENPYENLNTFEKVDSVYKDGVLAE